MTEFSQIGIKFSQCTYLLECVITCCVSLLFPGQTVSTSCTFTLHVDSNPNVSKRRLLVFFSPFHRLDIIAVELHDVGRPLITSWFGALRRVESFSSSVQCVAVCLSSIYIPSSSGSVPSPVRTSACPCLSYKSCRLYIYPKLYFK